MSKVNHPKHYQCGELLPDGTTVYEAINIIEAWGLNFNLGNVVKYILRSDKKHLSALEDLKKAQWYISRQIALHEAAIKTELPG